MRFDIGALPAAPVDAAVAFYAEVIPLIERALIEPLRDGVVEYELEGGDALPPSDAVGGDGALVDDAPDDGLMLVFGAADHTHRGWRLAAVQMLARAHAPLRINAVASADERAITAAERYLAQASGVTGQYWGLDGNGAGEVLS